MISTFLLDHLSYVPAHQQFKKWNRLLFYVIVELNTNLFDVIELTMKSGIDTLAMRPCFPSKLSKSPIAPLSAVETYL